MELFGLGLLWFVAFIFSTTLHEAAHALAAKLLGDPTAYHGGQVTMDPLPHMQREPLGMLGVPIISFIMLGGGWMMGWASVPYDPFWARKYPKRAAIMAFAGPLANLFLVLITALVIKLGIANGIFYEPEKMLLDDIVGAYNEGLPLVIATFLSIMFSLNVVLFIFNLLPFPPLDGSALFPLFLNEALAVRIMDQLRQPGVMFIGLIAIIFMIKYTLPEVHLFAINLLYPNIGYHHSPF